MTSVRWEIPIDKYGTLAKNYMPMATSLARTVNSSINTSQKIDLNSSTTLIQVYAISKDVYLKWATSDSDYVKPENFDEVIPAGDLRIFGVPNKVDGTPYSIIQVTGRENGATVIVVEK